MEASPFEDYFINVILKRKKEVYGDGPVIVVFDGHGSHLTFRTAQVVVDSNISLICLLTHTSHALQPLDVAVFKPLKDV